MHLEKLGRLGSARKASGRLLPGRNSGRRHPFRVEAGCRAGASCPRQTYPVPPQHEGRIVLATSETDHVYKILELVGSSETSIEDAIKNAVSRAAKTVREMKWFEVVQTRGHIENGAVRHYQVTLRVGFTLDE